MACEVEVNGCSVPNDTEPAAGESELEIASLKQSLKETLQHDVGMNGVEDVNGGSTNGNDVGVQNGHDEISIESEVDSVSTSKKRKTKRGKWTRSAKKEKKTKGPQKSPKNVEEEERSEVSWDDSDIQTKEADVKDTEDENSTIDVVGDNDDSAVVVEEYEPQTEDEIKIEYSDVKQERSTLSMLRDSMRFSISPKKKEEPASSATSATTSSTPDSIRDTSILSLRGITGRRPLHENSPYEAQSSSTKRKAEDDDTAGPQRKYIATSFSEHSPGWRFFTSPFTRLWTPRKDADVTVSRSTPLRKLHEDVDESLTLDEPMDISFQDDLETEKKEEKLDTENPTVEDNTHGKRWNCIVM